VTATLVVDASVAAKWLIPEVFAEHAARAQDPAYRRLAPDHWATELANVFWKKCVLLGQVAEDEARALMAAIRLLNVDIAPADELREAAFALALERRISVYDALYLALALREGCPFVTADRRLYNALAATLPDTLLWIEDLAAP
jgi:predicted nucleic acid-binding protein